MNMRTAQKNSLINQRQSGKVQANENRELCVDGVIVCTRGGGYPWLPFLRVTHEVDPNPYSTMISEHAGASHSTDVSRQSSNSDISTTQQGWHDELMTAMAAEGPTHSRRTVTHITPFRDRIKSIAANARRRHDLGGTYTPPQSLQAPGRLSSTIVRSDQTVSGTVPNVPNSRI